VTASDPRAVLAEHYGLADTPAAQVVGDGVVRVGNVAVKILPDATVARREADLLAILGAPDPRYRVQQLVLSTQGLRCVEVDGGVAIVTHWHEGTKKPYTEITEPEWRALGTQLAALHERIERFSGYLPRASRSTFDLAAERAALVDHPKRDTPAIARYLDERLALLDRFGERGMRPAAGVEKPIHNDYNQHNYLFDGTLPPLVLDWEGAIAALREYEVVRCLNHLPLVAPTHASAFVEGYRSVRTLDRAALRWAVDRSLLEHAVKSWPLERGAADALAGSMDVVHALHDGVSELERFFGLEAT
jgi:Ser/Thr protein kinase RdoA (MazF antagonist)